MEIRLNTNGHAYWLNPGRNVVEDLKKSGIDRVSISLNAGDKGTYVELCKPAFAEAYDVVLDFIRAAKPVLNVEVTAVRLPELDLAKIQAVAEELGVKFAIREYIPCFF